MRSGQPSTTRPGPRHSGRSRARSAWRLLALLTGLGAAQACGQRAAPPPRPDVLPPLEPGPQATLPLPGSATPVEPSAPLGQDTSVFDPSGQALAPWREALARVRAGRGQARAAFYGASHTSADLWTGHLRRLWQAAHGDAGHGFVIPLQWHPGYRHQDVVVRASSGWSVWRHRQLDPLPEGPYGYAGVALSSADPNQWLEVATTSDSPQGRQVSVLEIWYRGSPRAGTLSLEVDGRRQGVSTRGRAFGFFRLELPDGPHRLRLTPQGDGEVWLYGLLWERAAPGVILDQLGIPGMNADIILHWEEGDWRQMISRRRPDLVVLAYGTNAVSDDEPAAIYRERWRRVLERVRRAVPEAACLIIGPTDRPLPPDAEGRRGHRPGMDRVIAVQQQVAEEYGCGFWDAFAAMGGPGSMVRWVEAGLGTRDYVHLTKAGYERLAALLAEAMKAKSPER